jgi:hypothetical protein
MSLGVGASGAVDRRAISAGGSPRGLLKVLWESGDTFFKLGDKGLNLPFESLLGFTAVEEIWPRAVIDPRALIVTGPLREVRDPDLPFAVGNTSLGTLGNGRTTMVFFSEAMSLLPHSDTSVLSSHCSSLSESSESVGLG